MVDHGSATSMFFGPFPFDNCYYPLFLIIFCIISCYTIFMNLPNTSFNFGSCPSSSKVIFFSVSLNLRYLGRHPHAPIIKMMLFLQIPIIPGFLTFSFVNRIMLCWKLPGGIYLPDNLLCNINNI